MQACNCHLEVKFLTHGMRQVARQACSQGVDGGAQGSCSIAKHVAMQVPQTAKPTTSWQLLQQCVITGKCYSAMRRRLDHQPQPLDQA